MCHLMITSQSYAIRQAETSWMVQGSEFWQKKDYFKNIYYLASHLLSINHFPLMGKCQSRDLNNRINNLHKYSLRIAYQDKKSDFQLCLKRTRLIQSTGKPTLSCHWSFKTKEKSISPDVIRDISHFQEKKKLGFKEWYPAFFKKHGNNIVWKRDSVKLRAKILLLLPEELKIASSLQDL